MKIGFTGTRKGMTEMQKKTFKQFTKDKKITEFYDGNCPGSDVQSRKILFKTANHPITFHIHPSTLNAFVFPFRLDLTKVRHKIVIHPVKLPLERNHDIVDVLSNLEDRLIATPEGTEILRSGTWSTIRYARKKGRIVHIIDKEGKLSKR